MIFVLFPTEIYAQQYIEHQVPAGLNAGETEELRFTLTGISSTDIDEATLYYREEGELTYERSPVDIQDNQAVAALEIDEHIHSLEYYLWIEDYSGNIHTYPDSDAEVEPARVNIVEEDTEGIPGPVDYNILSPQPGEEVSGNDVMLAISMFYDEQVAVADSFRVYFAGEDVTEDAKISPYFISYLPGTMYAGDYPVRIAYDSGGNEYTVAQWSFTIRDRQAVQRQGEELSTLPSGRFELHGRNQSVAGTTRDIYRSRLQLSGRINEDIRYSLNGLLTNQESSRLQSRNRFGGELHYSDWFSFKGGHIYPSLNPLMMSGRRVYGINAELRLFNENVNLDFIYGNLARNISNQFTDIQMNINENEDGLPADTTFSLGFERGGRGAYQRRVIGGRAAFGSGERFQIGINALQVEDDINSLELIESVDDIPEDMMQSLAPDQRSFLHENEDAFRFEGNQPRPMGNFILASDLEGNFDDNRIRFRLDAGYSLVSNDISAGHLTRERADELGIDLSSQIESDLGRLSSFIVINENMAILPLRFEDSQAEGFIPMGAFGFHSNLNLNYFGNNLQVQYRWVGPGYKSLANSGIRRDVEGIRITDRFRMINNSVYVTLGYENFSDNVVDDREATTTTNIFRGDIGWYPANPNLPRIGFNTRYQMRDNDVDLIQNNFLEDAGISSDRAMRNVDLTRDEVMIQPRPRESTTLNFGAFLNQNFSFWNISHEASANFNWLDTHDEVFRYGDFSSNSYSLSLTSDFDNYPLRLNLQGSYTETESVSGLSNLDILGFSAGTTYRFLDERLSLRGEFALTENRREFTGLGVETADADDAEVDPIYLQFYQPHDDSEEEITWSYLFRGNLRFEITSNHAVVFSTRINNLVANETGRNIPNDQYFHAQYVFSF